MCKSMAWHPGYDHLQPCRCSLRPAGEHLILNCSSHGVVPRVRAKVSVGNFQVVKPTRPSTGAQNCRKQWIGQPFPGQLRLVALPSLYCWYVEGVPSRMPPRSPTNGRQLVSRLIYLAFFHPLSKYPGPWIAKFTNAYAAYHGWKGDIHLDMWRCHQRYGTYLDDVNRRYNRC